MSAEEQVPAPAPGTARILCSAKVICTGKTELRDGQVRLGFSPDYAEGRNAEWARWTPSLSLTKVVLGPVGEHYRMGGHYTLLFVEDDAAAFEPAP